MSPSNLPPEQTGEAAWYGPQMAARTDWLMPLAATDIAEIEGAVRSLVARDADIATIRAHDFPLPTLGARLARRVRKEVLNGRGFLLLRGLPVERWSMREAATAFFGLGSHLGSARSQNGKGHVLGHVRDLGLDVRDPNVRIYQTNERQTYHTDSCDIVGLLCLRTAQSGGLSALVSSTTIFNEMRRLRPDLLALLFQPLATDRRGEVPEGQKPYFEIPVFNWHQGFLSAIYQRQYIDSAQRFADAPRLTPEQVEALDLFDALANDFSDCFTDTPDFRPYTVTPVDPRIFDPEKAKDPKDPDYGQARKTRSIKMDDDDEMEEILKRGAKEASPRKSK